jgi:hypothetical protein
MKRTKGLLLGALLLIGCRDHRLPLEAGLAELDGTALRAVGGRAVGGARRGACRARG